MLDIGQVLFALYAWGDVTASLPFGRLMDRDGSQSLALGGAGCGPGCRMGPLADS